MKRYKDIDNVLFFPFFLVENWSGDFFFVFFGCCLCAEDTKKWGKKSFSKNDGEIGDGKRRNDEVFLRFLLSKFAGVWV